MHGHGHSGRHGESRHEHWGAGRHRRHGRFGGSGFDGGHGGRRGDMGAGRHARRAHAGAGRSAARRAGVDRRGPRHGYEIIKLVEEKTADWYSPSPGIVYPTLTYLEEAGYVTAAAEGSKKLYTITDEGRAYLETNRDLADVVLDRLGLARRTRQSLAARGTRRTCKSADAAAAGRGRLRSFARDRGQAPRRRRRRRSEPC